MTYVACGQGPAHGDPEGWAEAGGGGGCAEPPPDAPVEVRLRINANELLPNGPTAFTTTATTGDPPTLCTSSRPECRQSRLEAGARTWSLC